MPIATIVLYDTPMSVLQLYPLSLTRSIADIRHGIFTTKEWYRRQTNLPIEVLTSSYLNQPVTASQGHYLCIDSCIMPNLTVWQQLQTLECGCALEDELGLIGYCTDQLPAFGQFPLFFNETIQVSQAINRVTHPMHWVQQNAATIMADKDLLNLDAWSVVNGDANQVFGNYQVYKGEHALVKGCIFNTEDGPVYIDKNALVMEGCLIRGPVYIGENAVVKMGAQIYPGTTIGKKCTAGGEIKNSILGDYSNKAHHGYLGDSIVGQWCNLGAGTTNSNVKNTAGIVKMWDQYHNDFLRVCHKGGMVMGDYCRTAINASINTGTTFGISCNIFGSEMPSKNTPSFSWGLTERYILDKVISDLKNWYGFKNVPFHPDIEVVLRHLYGNIEKNEKNR